MNKNFDLTIIGTGPAGMTAGIYSAIYKINSIVLGKKIGGYAADAFKVMNFPGFPNTRGIELVNRMKQQLDDLKVPIKNETITKIDKINNGFSIKTDKETFDTKTIIIATGSDRRKLKIPGEEEFLGKGVAYCATCDAIFFKNKIVTIVGGSDAALSSALYLADITKKVYLIYRKDQPTALPLWIEKVKSNKKIIMIAKTNVTKIIGNNFVEKIELDNPYNNSNTIDTDGVFIEIGTMPLTNLVSDLKVNIDENGFMVVDKTQSTNVEGIFAAGDVTTNSNKFQQIITACAEGAVAANSVSKYLKK
jgi:thioredoxin reductase (NADPH)